jgi:hypothetical protein
MRRAIRRNGPRRSRAVWCGRTGGPSHPDYPCGLGIVGAVRDQLVETCVSAATLLDTEVEVLDLLDDHSRVALASAARPTITGPDVTNTFTTPSIGRGPTRGASKDPQGISRKTVDDPGTGRAREYAATWLRIAAGIPFGVRLR